MAQLEQSTQLSGSLDNRSRSSFQLGRQDSYTQVHDLADEEIHFSRYAPDLQHYYLPRTRVPGSNPGTSRPQTPRPSRRDSQAAPINRPNPADHYQATSSARAHHQHHHQIDLTQGLAPPTSNGGLISCSGADELEQVHSSRLLSNLGNKLRRSSNYLNAPAKLVGQYLLGITIQSWTEFFNTSRMTRSPCTTRHQLSRRLVANLSYFQGNYLCCSLVLVIYCILTSPLLLLAISIYLAALYLVTARSALGKQTRLLGYRLNLQQQYSFITLIALAPLWVAGAPSAIFWVIGASFFVVGLHASFYAIEQLASEQHSQQALASAGNSLNYHHHHHSGSSSLARVSQSLAVHTPTHQLNRQGYAQLDSTKPSDSMHNYYNHYPGVSRVMRQQQAPGDHLQGPAGVAAYSQLAGPNSPPAASPSSNYMPSALAQWTIFGGSRRASVGTSKAGSQAGDKKQPDVKIISRDYAGLGRVYEV